MTSYYASIILTAHGGTSEQDLLQCIHAINGQTLDDEFYEVLLVVDKNPGLTEMAETTFGNQSNIQILSRDIDNGLADARNYAASLANNDVLVFLDTDARPDTDWLRNILNTFEQYPCHVVGGPAYGDWPNETPPRYFPSDLNWLVGVTHDGFSPESGTDPRDRDNSDVETKARPFPVRNPFGCNFAVLRDTFESVNGFNTRFGKADVPLQGEEVDLCLRIMDRASELNPVMYHPEAAIYHDVSSNQLLPTTLLERSFWQGVTKAFLEDVAPQPDSIDTEHSYLSFLFTNSIPHHAKQFPVDPFAAFRILLILSVVGAVGTGYVAETARRTLLD